MQFVENIFEHVLVFKNHCTEKGLIDNSYHSLLHTRLITIWQAFIVFLEINYVHCSENRIE